MQEEVPMNPRILVVDDEPIVRTFIRAALRSHGYDVLTAASAAEAAEISGVDLLLTEFELPDASGEVLAARLRKKQRCLRVIYTTGQSQLKTSEAVLYKPFTTAVLLDAIGSQCCCHPKAA